MTMDEDELTAEFIYWANRYVDVDGIGSVYRPFDVDNSSNTFEFTFTVPQSLDVPEPVMEGEELPRSGQTFETRTVTFDKFGGEVTTEANEHMVQDTANHIAYTIAEQGRELLYDELPVEYTTTPNRLNAIREAVYTACGDDLTPSDIDTVVVTDILATYIADNHPTKDVEDLFETFESELGVDIAIDEHNTLRAGDIVVADSSRLGYRPKRTDFEMDSYTEYRDHDFMEDGEPEGEPDRTVVRGYTRLSHIVLEPDAGRIVRFRYFDQ